MNRQRPWLPVAFFLALIMTRVHAATTVALVSTCGGEAGQNVLALSETALSGETDITLVERREVARVLQEQELMSCGLSKAGQAVAAGKLLGVQVFASLETVPNEKEALGLVVFDAASGVVLWDAILSGTNVEQAAAEVDAAVKAGCEKRLQPAGDLTTVCILSLRNADLPREFDSSCQAIGNILERQLVQSPSLAVLDRQHLENVNKERLLPIGLSTNKPLPSLVLIELEISRGHPTNGLSATAVLSDSAGAKLGRATVSIDSENPADLSDRLLLELEKMLKATPSRIIVDRAREAERFARESQFLIGSGELVSALRASEAASALMPTNTEYQARLAECLGRYADQRLQENRADLGYSLDLAFRVLDISRTFHGQAIARKGTTTQWYGPERWVKGYYFWDNVLPVADGQDADTMRKVLEFQQQSRELILDVLDRLARTEVKDQRDFEAYTQLLRWRLFDVERFASSSSLWTDDTLDCYRSWMKMAETFSLDWDSEQFTSTRILARLCNQVKGSWKRPKSSTETWTQSQTMPHIQHWELQPEDIRQFDKLFHEMEQHPDPVISAYGLAGQLSVTLRDTLADPGEVEQQYRRAKEFIRNQIATPRRGSAIQHRELLYNAALDLTDLLPDPPTRQQEYQGLFDFMLGRKETEYWVTRMVIDPHGQVYKHYLDSTGDIFPRQPGPQMAEDSTRLIDNAQRVRALRQSGGSQDIDTAKWSSNTGSFERELDWIQLDIKTNSDSTSSVPWTSSRLLFPASGILSGSSGSILGATTDANAVYVVYLPGEWGTPLRVARVPLDGRQSEYLGDALYRNQNYYGDPKVAVPALGEDRVFVGTDKGIFGFPLNGGATQHITTADGLPTDEINSLACVDGKLYAGLGGGYLIAYDLKTNGCEILASSRRREAKNGLDNLSPPPTFKFMIPDPERHRVLFTVDLETNVRCTPQWGLWQIDTTTGQIKQLVQLYSRPKWAESMGDGTMLVRFYDQANNVGSNASCNSAISALVSYELATGRTRLLCADEPKAASPLIPAPDEMPRMPRSGSPPHAVIDGWVWFNDSGHVGRVSTNRSTVEYFPQSIETLGGPIPWKCFHPIENHGGMLIENRFGIWLLNLKGHEISENTSKNSR